MKLKHIFLPSFLIMLILTLCGGQVQAQNRRPKHQRPNNEVTQGRNFETYLHAKCEMVIREMGLSSFDSAHFEPIYHQLQKEKMELYHKYGNVRRLRRAIEEGKQVPDSTILRVLNNNAKLQVEDALLEQAYLNKMARVLTPLQIFKLQQAEQKYRKDAIRRVNPTKK